ncbi:hypothetical protein V2J09_011897 [Rumex salicifolius]
MGGEEKKPEEQKPAEKVAGDGDKKKAEGEKKKTEEGGGGGGEAKESSKDGKEEPPAPPPPPPEIVLRVFMHCEGCARKVKKCLRGFNGVEDVTTDCKNHTVVVKGEKADPLKVLERIQRKSHRHVELLSPIPTPPSEEEVKKAEEKEPPKEEKKEEPKVITVVLKVHMHCEACAQEIKKRIEKMKEVEVATPDLKSSEVTVKGTFDPPKLVDYIYKRTGKQAIVVKQDPEEAKEEGEKKEGKEEKKDKNGEEEKKGVGDGDAKPEKKEGGDGGGEAAEGGGEALAAEEDIKLVEMRRNELFYYPPKYGMQMYHSYPPQIFSDENPNACSIM